MWCIVIVLWMAVHWMLHMWHAMHWMIVHARVAGMGMGSVRMHAGMAHWRPLRWPALLLLGKALRVARGMATRATGRLPLGIGVSLLLLRRWRLEQLV